MFLSSFLYSICCLFPTHHSSRDFMFTSVYWWQFENHDIQVMKGRQRKPELTSLLCFRYPMMCGQVTLSLCVCLPAEWKWHYCVASRGALWEEIFNDFEALWKHCDGEQVNKTSKEAISMLLSSPDWVTLRVTLHAQDQRSFDPTGCAWKAMGGSFSASFALWPLQGPHLVLGGCPLGLVTICSMKASGWCPL